MTIAGNAEVLRNRETRYSADLALRYSFWSIRADARSETGAPSWSEGALIFFAPQR